jgi:hypothetical protein
LFLQNILEFSEQRQAQLDELEAAFRQLNAQQDSSPKLSDLKKYVLTIMFLFSYNVF